MQAQIRPVSQSPFQPAWWLKHAHLQTIFAKYLSPKQRVSTQAEMFSLPDGDEIQLNWLANTASDDQAPLLILLHGLAGDINSHYIQAMLAQCQQLNWPAVLMHFRGCNGKPNKLPRAYHSGDTADAALLISEVQRRYPNRPLVAVGYSLGGNVLLKYCGEQAEQNPLAAAVAVCPPLSLAACAKRINSGASKLYQRYLLGRLKRSTLAKLQQFTDFPLPLTPQQVQGFSSIEQFDELVDLLACAGDFEDEALIRRVDHMRPENLPDPQRLGRHRQGATRLGQGVAQGVVQAGFELVAGGVHRWGLD